MSWRRRIAILAVALVALIGAAAGAFYWIVATESGTGWALERAASRLGPEFSIGRFRGRLIDRVEIEDLSYRTDELSVSAEQISIVVDWLPLTAGTLAVDDLFVDGLVVEVEPSSGGSGDIPELPIDVDLRSAVFTDLVIAGAEPVRLAQVTLGARLTGTRLAISRLETSYEGFALSAQGDVLMAAEPMLTGTVSASGRIDQQQVLGSVNFDGTWPSFELRAELLEPWVASAQAEITIGEALSFRTELETELDNTPLAVNAIGSLSDTLLVLDELDIDYLGIEVRANGRADFATMTWQANVDARDVDPAQFVDAVEGRVSVAGDLAGELVEGTSISTEGLSFTGELNGFEVTGELVGSAADLRDATIERLDLQVGSNSLTAKGRVSTHIAADVELDLPDLASLYPDASGAATASVTLTGPLERPLIDGEAQVRSFRYREYAFEQLDITGTAEAAVDGSAELSLVVLGPARDRPIADSVRATVSGRVDRHRIVAELEASEWRADVAVDGGLAAGVWRARIDRLDVDQSLLGLWQLDEPAELELADGRAELSSSCMRNGAASICAVLRYAGQPSDRLLLTADDFPIEALSPLWPSELAIEGRYALEIELSRFSQNPQGRLSLVGGETELAVDLGGDDRAATLIDSLNLTAELADWRLTGELAAEGQETGRVRMRFESSDIRTESAPIAGEIDAFWPDLAALSVLSPDLGQVAGTASASVRIGGTALAPQIEGRASWDAGSIEVPAWNLIVDGIAAEATSPDGTTLAFAGTGLVDGSELRLTGTTELSAERSWPTELRLTGDRIGIVRLTDAQVFVSPDLTAEVALPDVRVRGTVVVPSADIALEQLPEQAVRPSADAVVHGAEEAPPNRVLAVNADLEVQLGDDVHYRGSGLNADLGGSLNVQYQSGLNATANGVVNIDGTYDTYGQSLELERGELLFAGPLDNPTVDVRAVRRVGETTVGVELRGTLQAPQTSIVSTPAMSEADALSYLLFGRPLSGSGEEDTATLRSAAVSMGLSQALPVVQRIGNSLGLDELSIESNEVDEGALMAGKYLSPKVYIRYSYGLFNRIGGLLVRFDINNRLSLETRSGDQKSMDLLYTVEKE